MARTFEESEFLYEQVKTFFSRQAEEADFIVLISDGAMESWKIIPTASVDEMFSIRARLRSEGIDYGGFGDFGGRLFYCFLDQNLSKTQYLDNGEIHCFNVRKFCEFDLTKIAKELNQFSQGS